MSDHERNKAIVRSLKECQGTEDQDATLGEIISPQYRYLRGGLMHLGTNALGQDFPEPGRFLRDALPDRVDTVEDIVAESDRVAMIWRMEATHTGNLFGIPPTGKTIDIREIGFFRVVEGKIVEGWFMADELGLLIQLGVQLPTRNDGRRIALPLTDEDGPGDALVERLLAGVTTAQGHKALEGEVHGAFPDRQHRIRATVADEDGVWMRGVLRGTNTEEFLGLPPTGRHVAVDEVGISRFDRNEWVEGWYLTDVVGMLLQLDALEVLEEIGCRPIPPRG